MLRATFLYFRCRSAAALALLIVWAPFVAVAQQPAHIGVASNFNSTMQKLEAAFEENSNHEIVVSSGSTGKLYAQIVNGAPFDIFLSADAKRPELLEANSVGVAGSRFTYAIGQIVLWDPRGNAVGPERIRSGEFRRLTIANPRLAPYGRAAQQILDALGIIETRERFAYGENIAQSFAFVQTGAADLGFVALTQILQLPEDERGAYWTPLQEQYDPVRQDAVLLKRGSDNKTAIAFMEFLKTDEAKAIIAQSGYEID
ncbi:MAG: molybdate ABC transporter substrate-binding protein [Marinicaulis sp.]|nr:molybdate ABC transporter substrate-binding protein [Marinicaulis sp.]